MKLNRSLCYKWIARYRHRSFHNPCFFTYKWQRLLVLPSLDLTWENLFMYKFLHGKTDEYHGFSQILAAILNLCKLGKYPNITTIFYKLHHHHAMHFKLLNHSNSMHSTCYNEQNDVSGKNGGHIGFMQIRHSSKRYILDDF